jgi:hypothetical protein
VALLDEPRDSPGEHGGLASAGAGDHQHRAVDVFDGLTLTFVGFEGSRGRNGFRSSH